MPRPLPTDLIHRDEVKISSALRREHLHQMSDAQQFQHARCHVGEFKDAWPLLDCGRLEANQRAEARAIQMFYTTKVDNDATAKRDEGPHQFFYLTRGVTDQLAMTLDCRHLIPVFIFIFRLLKFTVLRHSHGASRLTENFSPATRVLQFRVLG